MKIRATLIYSATHALAGSDRHGSHIAAYMNELVLIALTLDAAFSLREITGTPRAIQIVKCDQTILHVGARAHLGRAAHQDAHLTAAYLCEQFSLFDLRIGIVDERDLFRGCLLYTSRCV